MDSRDTTSKCALACVSVVAFRGYDFQPILASCSARSQCSRCKNCPSMQSNLYVICQVLLVKQARSTSEFMAHRRFA